jgi:hypothetical protein
MPDFDILALIADPLVIAELRETPEKLLFLGFDSKARAIEVVTDTGTNGEIYIIHADFTTKEHGKILGEALK